MNDLQVPHNDYTLTPAQTRLAVAVAADRQRIVDDANHIIAEINAAEAELVELLRKAAGLPEGRYRLEGNQDAVRLVAQENTPAD